MAHANHHPHNCAKSNAYAKARHICMAFRPVTYTILHLAWFVKLQMGCEAGYRLAHEASELLRVWYTYNSLMIGFFARLWLKRSVPICGRCRAWYCNGDVIYGSKFIIIRVRGPTK